MCHQAPPPGGQWHQATVSSSRVPSVLLGFLSMCKILYKIKMPECRRLSVVSCSIQQSAHCLIIYMYIELYYWSSREIIQGMSLSSLKGKHPVFGTLAILEIPTYLLVRLTFITENILISKQKWPSSHSGQKLLSPSLVSLKNSSESFICNTDESFQRVKK